MDSVFFKQIHIAGYAGELAENVISNWLLGLRESNPAILDMFHDIFPKFLMPALA